MGSQETGKDLVRVRLTDRWPSNGYNGGGLVVRRGEVVTVPRDVLTDRQDLHPGCFEEVVTEGERIARELEALLEGSAADVVAELQAGAWDDHLEVVESVEVHVKNRKTVLQAIEARKAQGA